MEIMTIAKPFFEGLRDDKFLLPWCKSCGKTHFYPRSACPHCWGDEYDWRPAAGTGTVDNITVVRANPPTAFRDKMPYTIAIVELDEGVRLLSNVLDEPGTVSIGDRVQVEIAERDGEMIPLFRRMP
jgi:uncharacterized OB-fold protein